MADISVSATSNICNDNISTKPFSSEVVASFHKYDSKLELFRAIFQAVFFTLDLSRFSTFVIESVKRMLKCGSTALGYSVHQCPSCGHYKIVPFTCKSRLCCSCGNLRNMQAATAIAEKMFNVEHRHAVFTIPDTLRPYFKQDPALLNILFEAAFETAQDVIHSICPKLDVRCGVIAVCHTFSRSSRWNPHIHMILTEGGITKYGKWFNLRGGFLNYAALRKGFQKRLLKKLHRKLGPSFAPVANSLLIKYPNGFYVHVPPTPSNMKGKPKRLVKYLSRYLGRPCIASSRIDGFDGKYVYYHYRRHPDEKLYYEKVSADEFVLRLLQHFPPKNFQMVRYYGIYSNSLSASGRVKKALNSNQVSFLYSKSAHELRVRASHWRGAMLRAFHVDPCKCPICQTEMAPLYMKYKGRIYWFDRKPGHRIIKRRFPPQTTQPCIQSASRSSGSSLQARINALMG